MAEDVEVTTQMASQDYDCDAMCDVPIPEETLYVRVAHIDSGKNHRSRPSAGPLGSIEKFHPSCWEAIVAS